VYWKTGCISYAVQRDGSPAEGITAAQVSALLDEGFRTWSHISCPSGDTPVLTAQSQGPVACDAVEFNCQDPSQNSNIVMFRDEYADDPTGLRYGVIALTTITANLVTGEIFDADMELNSHDENFTLDGTTEVSNSAPRNLHGVINHELGHFLGLSHTRVQGSLMQAAYQGTTEPQADDISGMCAALQTGPSDPVCSVRTLPPDAGCLGSDVSCKAVETQPGDPGGCACREARSRSGAFGPWGGLGALALVLGRRWRSRRVRMML
jgi:predicted Zn-dependent protease